MDRRNIYKADEVTEELLYVVKEIRKHLTVEEIIHSLSTLARNEKLDIANEPLHKQLLRYHILVLYDALYKGLKPHHVMACVLALLVKDIE
jgi:fructose-1,6-bisphosphatase